MKIQEKIQSQKGFSLVEVIMAMAVLALITGFLGGEVIVVKDAYQNVTLRSEANLLLSMVITEVSTQLQHSKEAQNQDGTVSFYSLERKCRIFFENGQDQNIYVKTETGTKVPLLTNKVITSGLTPKIENLDYNGEFFTYEANIYYEGEVYVHQKVYIRPIN